MSSSNTEGKTRISDTAATDTLHAHITQAIGAAQNALITRRDHPTYGYSKVFIRTSLDKAEGMLVAWCILTRRIMSTREALPDDLPEVERLRSLRNDLKAAR
jgi:hypothetical protein